MSKTRMNRRTFLKVSTLAGSSLLVGCSFSSPKLVSTKEASEGELGLWVRIGKDNSITLILPSAEMGQHAHTGQAMIVAEELEANWESINVVTAPINSEYVNPELFNKQRTDGSTSISAFWDKLRYVGASTRMMLTQAAANEWGVSVEEGKAENGFIFHRRQEIQEVLPEIVSGRANGYLGVKYEKIVPLLIESIKENTKKIKELEQEINEINKNCDCLNK